MKYPSLTAAALATCALVLLILITGAVDYTGHSQSASVARSDPVLYWASSLVWLIVFSPIWLPAMPLIRNFVWVRWIFSFVGVVVAGFLLSAASGSIGYFIPVFSVSAVVVLFFCGCYVRLTPEFRGSGKSAAHN